VVLPVQEEAAFVTILTGNAERSPPMQLEISLVSLGWFTKPHNDRESRRQRRKV
jgi:hypothetical protein